MVSIQSATLSKTLKYRAKSGKQFKYEIYQSGDGEHLIAMIYMLEELMSGSGVKVWSVLEEDLVLLSGGRHPDYALSIARDHFNENYFRE